MSCVKIKVAEIGTTEDLKQWKEHMMKEPQCWNKFCYGCYGKKNMKAVHVTKVDSKAYFYIITLCDDSIGKLYNNDIFVNENHIIVETNS